MSLQWEVQELLVGRRTRPIKVQLARAPDGSWYGVWRDESGWTIGHATSGFDFDQRPFIAVRDLEIPTDGKLVAEVWASGNGRVVRQHDYAHVVHRDDPKRGWVADSWHCRCGASGLDFDNVCKAAAAARDHWREALTAMLPPEPSADTLPHSRTTSNGG